MNVSAPHRLTANDVRWESNPITINGKVGTMLFGLTSKPAREAEAEILATARELVGSEHKFRESVNDTFQRLVDLTATWQPRSGESTPANAQDATFAHPGAFAHLLSPAGKQQLRALAEGYSLEAVEHWGFDGHGQNTTQKLLGNYFRNLPPGKRAVEFSRLKAEIERRPDSRDSKLVRATLGYVETFLKQASNSAVAR